VIDLAELRASLPTAWLRTSERVVEVTGADRLTYLDATTSQSLASRAPGEAVGALVLDAHGLALAVLEVLVLEDRVLLVVPDDEVAATVLDILGGRTFLSDARFVLTDDVVLRVHGPAAAALVADAFAGAFAGSGHAGAGNGARRRRVRHRARGCRVRAHHRCGAGAPRTRGAARGGRGCGR
jgi:folate-binding Fe-S cluster repair protein YgfZ